MTTKKHRCRLLAGVVHTAALLVSMLLLGCGAAHSTPAPAAHPTNAAASFRPLTLPSVQESGDNIQVTRLLDEPYVTVLAIRLRHGAEFPTHNAPVPVIIQAASGTATVIMGNDRVPIGDGRFVALAPKRKHSVLPDSDADVVLLVTQIRSGGAK